ncbi:hypothetical protein GE061_014156 [Apolygus lucorum]|uniref:Uncharacterized protein n=1 Tax=Apolygus lucorum TaxID=248454 RepID=A0A6A4KE49_APOLU|nr:hypothetical protein GE061_014156 [Apolygus lucorum]
MKRKSPADARLDPENSADASMKWGQKRGEYKILPVKTYVTNSKAKKTAPNDIKLKRMQVLSCIIQLEEKSYIECPNKGCRCIIMSLYEIVDHMASCEGGKSNDLLTLCKYCPHGMITTMSLSNHIVISHPYAIEALPPESRVYDNSVNDDIKTKFMTSNDFKQTVRNYWRIYLESKGCIMCLIPCCHYVTSLISKMEVHFLLCGPEEWPKLACSCDVCPGKTFTKEELDDHVVACHESELFYNCCDDQLREFWELTLRVYEVSKCVSKGCKFIAHNILSLEKHYRYCRKPCEGNFDVCALCGGWFDNIYDLWNHKTRFHVIGKANKIKKLMSIDVHHPGTSLLKINPTSSSSESPVDSSAPNKLQVKDVVLKNTSFLGELAKTIESESRNDDSVDVRITVENQFSWSLTVPNLNKATEVVSRRLPSYSVKKIMAESIEDGAKLLKLSETVSRIACHPSKSYIPPRPLDFVVDNPNVMSKLRRKFVPMKPVTKALEALVNKKGPIRERAKEKCVKKSTPSSDKTIEISAEKSRSETSKLNLLKSNAKRQPGIKTLLPMQLLTPHNNPEHESRSCALNPVGLYSDMNDIYGDVATLECEDSSVLIRDEKARGAKDSSPKGTQNVISPKGLLQYPSAKSRSDCPGIAEHPRPGSILLKTDGKMQIPSTLKLVRVVRRSNPSTPPPKTVTAAPKKSSKPPVTARKNKPTEKPPITTIAKPAKSVEPFTTLTPTPPDPPASVITVQNISSEVERTCSPVETFSIPYDSDASSCSHSSIPFELPILPPTKSVIFGKACLISDYYERDPPNSREDSKKSDYKLVRTYGRNRGLTATSGNRTLIIENCMTNEDYLLRGSSGIFTDEMDVDHQNSDSVEDPLNIEINVKTEVKDEPVDDYEESDPSAMFHDSYDVFDVSEESSWSYPFDSSIPFDVICESSEAVSAGLYNDQCPWEQAHKKRKSDRNSKKYPSMNPYRSKNLLSNGVCDPHAPALFGNVSSTGPTLECNLSVPDSTVLIDNVKKEGFQNLLNHLVNPNGNFVNEPMIYTVHEMIQVKRGSSFSINVAEEGTFRSSNLYSPHYGDGYYNDEFLELVNYLTHYNERRFVNEPIVYAVDRLVHDDTSKKNGTGSNSKKERQTSRKSSGLQVDSSDPPATSSKSYEKAVEDCESSLPTSKRKRRSAATTVKNDEGISLKESAEALLSLGRNNGSGEGSMVDNTEEVVKSSTSRGEPSSKRVKMTLDEEPRSVPVEDQPGSATTSRGKRMSRKSARVVEVDECVEEDDVTQKTKTARKSRSSCKVLIVQDVEEIAPGVIVPLQKDEKLPEEDDEEEKPVKRRGRPPKRKSRPVLKGINVPKSSFGLDNQPCEPKSPESMLYIAGDNEPETKELVPADQRIIFTSKLVDPHKMVECAVCGDSMTAVIYKKEHVIKHNHLCWLKGEEPMDLEDEKGVERYLYRIYLKTRSPFYCEVCGVPKKSALGFVTHKKFCGKSAQERKDMMVSCSICSRILLPSSLHNHMIKSHPAVASTPEEPRLEGRIAASKCLDVLSTNAKDMKNDQEYIDENEELQAAEKHSWIRQVYAFCKRRVQKDQRNIIEEAAEGSQSFRCVIASCDYSDPNIINVIEHYRSCDREPLDCRCKECPFMTNSEPRMINHIRMSHFKKAKEYSSKKFKSSEISDVSDMAGAFIPYIKSGELSSRSILFLQPAVYWTRDLRAEHLSVDPVFLDWEIAGGFELETTDNLDSYLCLKDESIRIKSSDKSSSWSVLKKFTCESFNDDVRILYTGGVVRALDWFPSSSSQYLAVSVGPFDSENISAAPVHSGPGHFQIWSVGALDNFSGTYDADPRIYLNVCHEFGEIWDIECCPSGGRSDKRLGLVAIGTSSGSVAVYSIPLLEDCSEERATRMEPVTVLELGIQNSYQVSKISWSKTKPHRFIAAGFTNGLVAVWDLTTTSSLLKSGNTILPFKSFHPHLSIISALSFCPVNEYYIATGCAEKSAKFWNLHDTTYNHGEFTRGLVTGVAWLPHWMSALNSLDDNYTIGTTTVILSSIRNFIYQSQPAVTQADSTGLSISVNNWLNTFVCGYDSGQIVLSIARKFNQQYEDRRKVFNCLLNPKVHDFNPKSSEMVGCKSYSSTSERYGVVFNHNFQMNNQTKIRGNPCSDLQCFPLTPVNEVSWNPNPNSFLTLASGFHSGFIIISRVKVPTMENNILKNISEQFNTDEVPKEPSE